MWEIWRSTPSTLPHLGKQPSVVEKAEDKVSVTHKMVCKSVFIQFVANIAEDQEHFSECEVRKLITYYILPVGTVCEWFFAFGVMMIKLS